MIVPYRILEEKSLSDVAFEASGKSIEELFHSAARAVTDTMIANFEAIEEKTRRSFDLADEEIDMLLFHFLQEIIFYKDAEGLLFSRFDLEIPNKKSPFLLHAVAHGEEIDPRRHELIVDVKAVSLHEYRVEETASGWEAEVILDV